VLRASASASTTSASSSSPPSAVDLDSLREQIRAKGDEIRSLKAGGVSKEELQPHVRELQALKAQLPQQGSEAEGAGAADVSAKQKKTEGAPSAENSKPKKQQPQQQSAPLSKKKSSKGSEPPSQQLSESELRSNRLAKVQAMREAGLEPFAYGYQATSTASGLAETYEGGGGGPALAPGEEDAGADVSVAGRVLTRRVFGKLAFFTLQDETGVIQLQFDQNRLGESFKVRWCRAPPRMLSASLSLDAA
jgi:hypothetical protein